MIDIFGILDAAIEEFGREHADADRSSRDQSATGTATGILNALNTNTVPAIPVVPAANQDVSDLTPISSTDGDGVALDIGGSAPQRYLFQNTGSTGSTGTSEDLCGIPSSRAPFANGNNGNSSGGDAGLGPPRQGQIRYLVEHGLFIDFETRSAVDLRAVGSSVYAEHPSTDVWVACYAIGTGHMRVWYPGDPVPADLAAHVRSGLPLVAHNATFERTIWSKIMAARHGWPEPELAQWHCTAAMAAAMALPRKLEDAARVTGCSFQKDMEGHRLMLQMSRPLSIQERRCVFCGAAPGQPRPQSCLCEPGRDRRTHVTWKNDLESIKRGTEYCIRDVETERELLTKLLPLPPAEREVWLLDQRINDRGITVDLPTARNAKNIADEHRRKLNAELREVTGGAVDAATQLPKLTAWLKDQGVEMPGVRDELGKEEIERLLGRRDLPPSCSRALAIRLEASKTSTAKLDAYIARTSPDGRLRETLLYQGAGRTGRWAGRGAQLQNLPRGEIKRVKDAVDLIGMGFSVDWIEGLFGPPLEVVSACLRLMLIAAPGCELIGADYNAIEARGTAWLAGAARMLGIFRRGDDPYRDMAARIYGRAADSFSKTSRERQLGKIAVLGLGYQMGADRFASTCAKQGVLISPEEAENIKQIYRQTNPEIVQFWRTLEAAAVQAVQDPGTWVSVANGRVGFLKEDERLYLRLPSGRCLIYANPRYEQVETKFGPRWGLTFDGISNATHQWERQQLYGGKLTENAVQAICRDLLAAALLRVETVGYPVVLHVHDEIVAEVLDGTADVGDFERLMAEAPDWAHGFPIQAEGWRGKRFGK